MSAALTALTLLFVFLRPTARLTLNIKASMSSPVVTGGQDLAPTVGELDRATTRLQTAAQVRFTTGSAN
jgi:hypothetical protein